MVSKLVCKSCGAKIPYRSPDFNDDRCDPCINRAEHAREAAKKIIKEQKIEVGIEVEEINE